MPRALRTELGSLILVGVCLLPAAWGQSAIRRVQVLGSKNAVEIEIEASERLVPQTQVLTGPDRLVVDFPNATPGAQLRSQSVNRGEVKDVRVGLFQSKPPVTRVVLDLSSPQSYQVFPYGRTVIIKVTGAAAPAVAAVGPAEPGVVDDFPPPTRPGLVTANYVAAAEPIQALPPEQSPLEVTYKNGLLSIRSNKATLSEVLFAVHQRTGADVAIAAGAEQEKVVAALGPAPAAEVLANLLNGSRFNFLIMNSPDDPNKLDRVILTMRSGGGAQPLPQVPATDDDSANEPSAPPQNQSPRAAQPQQPPASQPEIQAGEDQNPD